MAGPGNVEFLGDDGRVLDDDDVVDISPRGVPRAVAAIAVLAAVAVAAAALTATHAGRSVPRARPPLPSPHASHPANSIAADSASLRGGTVSLYDGDPTVDIALAGNRLYVLQTDRVSVIDTRTLNPIASTRVGVVLIAGHERLALDPPHNRGWIVDITAAPSRVITFDMSSLA
ncbi:MAG: hypothetical protein QOG80_2363, partial [Pseudonocardiales bacterium]|nr:hypothetical protein [Pseudonocardiales bacterium]